MALRAATLCWKISIDSTQPTKTIVDSTDAAGAYAIPGISGTINATSIAATKTGYIDTEQHCARC